MSSTKVNLSSVFFQKSHAAKSTGSGSVDSEAVIKYLKVKSHIIGCTTDHLNYWSWELNNVDWISSFPFFKHLSSFYFRLLYYAHKGWNRMIV